MDKVIVLMVLAGVLWYWYRVERPKDEKKQSYNPFLLCKADPEQYLLLAMERCTDYYERLPLVQDKKILDNILYSGVWVTYRNRSKRND